MGALKIVSSSYKFLILIGVGIVLLFFDKSLKKREVELFKSGKLTIGTFKQFYYSPGSRGSDRTFKYFFYDETGKYHDGDSAERSKYPDSKKRKTIFEGDWFLVIYDDKGSLILFDHPICDSTDFKKYVQEFELKRGQK